MSKLNRIFQTALIIFMIVAIFITFQSIEAQNNYTMKLGEPLPSNIFVELSKKINPAVVSISVSINYRNNPGAYRDPFWDFFEQYAQPNQIQKPQAVGTGFIIDQEGTIVTNYHVIEQADNIYVHLSDDPKSNLEAKVIGGDKRTDVAILKVETSKKLPTVELGESSKVEVGEWVAAFGNPFGHEFSVTKGIVSAKGRKIRDLNAVPFIQTDATINPGNSGGPLVNMKGQVIAVNAAIDARGPGIGFAIPIDHVKSILPQLKQFGRVLRGYIGVQIDNISPRAKAVLKLPSLQGALVMGIVEGSPADRAGLRAYDVITKFEKTDINEAEDLSDAVKDFQIGKKAKLEYLREGKKASTEILIDNPPDEPRVAKAQPSKKRQGDLAPFSIGFKVVDFSVQMAQELGIKPGSARGPIVVEVQSGSPAAKNGLRTGDIILDVNQAPVKSAKDVIQALKKGSNILRVQNKNQVSLIFLDI